MTAHETCTHWCGQPQCLAMCDDGPACTVCEPPVRPWPPWGEIMAHGIRDLAFRLDSYR